MMYEIRVGLIHTSCVHLAEQAVTKNNKPPCFNAQRGCWTGGRMGLDPLPRNEALLRKTDCKPRDGCTNGK